MQRFEKAVVTSASAPGAQLCHRNMLGRHPEGRETGAAEPRYPHGPKAYERISQDWKSCSAEPRLNHPPADHEPKQRSHPPLTPRPAAFLPQFVAWACSQREG